jgi:cell division protein FtsQ
MSFDQTLSRTRGRRRPLRALRLGRPRLRLLVAIVVLAVLLAGGWMWLRDSSLVRVTDVQVTGADSSAGPRIRAALDSAARDMTTLHVRDGALERAVAGFPSVAALRVQADFPHRLAIEVVERRPVAVVTIGDQRVATTGGGILLRDVDAPSGLPAVALDGSLGDGAVRDARTLALLSVAAAAPAPLRQRTTRISWGPRGLVADLRDGPPLIFGVAADAVAKWAAAARVLAEPSAAGATYLDLRVTGRVAAGGLDPVTEEDPDGDTQDPTGTTQQAPAATPTPYPQP